MESFDGKTLVVKAHLEWEWREPIGDGSMGVANALNNATRSMGPWIIPESIRVEIEG